MVVVASTTPNLKATPNLRSQSNPKRRPPLLTSERDSNVDVAAGSRRPKSRAVNSRYLSTSSSSSTSGSSSSNSSLFSSSRRCPSLVPAKNPAPATPALKSSAAKRSQSAERRLPATPRLLGGEMSAAAKLLVSSTRSLSVSFQGESVTVPMIKTTKPASSPNLRKATPERKTTSSIPRKGGNQGENARSIEHQPWPGRSRPVTSLSRSVDLGCDGKKLINGSAKVFRAPQESLMRVRDSYRTYSDDKLRRSLNRNEMVMGVRDTGDASCANGFSLGSESRISGTESASSECNSSTSIVRSKGGGRSLVVPARFWQETDDQLKRVSEPGSPSARNIFLKGTVPPKLITTKKHVPDSAGASPMGTVNNRGFSSPLRGSVRPASPSLLGTALASDKSSPSGRIASPLRMRNATAGAFANSIISTPSVLHFGADVKRVKVGDNRLGDVHLLRLLHNRHLQWRFGNARAETSLSIQKTNAERSLYNAWRMTSDLRGAVSSKRKELQWLRQKLKLVSILKGQMLYLEEWALTDKDHSNSLSGAIESLKASTIRLPVVGGVRADIQNVKEAICSAADVMQAMASSICSLLSKVEEVNSLVEEVVTITTKEHSLLNKCSEILLMLTAMQVKDCSLRTHILQLKFAPSSLAIEV